MDIEDLITDVDSYSDAILSLCHYAKFCTFKSSPIECSAHILSEIEKDIVPTITKIYLESDPEERRRASAHLNVIRRLWKTEMETLESSILDIVDSGAFVVVANDVIRSISSVLKKEQYSQDPDFLRSNVSKVVEAIFMGFNSLFS